MASRAGALTLLQHALSDGLRDLAGAQEADLAVPQADRVGDATLPAGQHTSHLGRQQRTVGQGIAWV